MHVVLQIGRDYFQRFSLIFKQIKYAWELFLSVLFVVFLYCSTYPTNKASFFAGLFGTLFFFIWDFKQHRGYLKLGGFIVNVLKLAYYLGIWMVITTGLNFSSTLKLSEILGIILFVSGFVFRWFLVDSFYRSKPHFWNIELFFIGFFLCFSTTAYESKEIIALDQSCKEMEKQTKKAEGKVDVIYTHFNRLNTKVTAIKEKTRQR